MRTPPRILAVDDDPDSLAVLRVRLSAQGYEVLSAADGEEALAAFREHAPDLLVLDVTMPRLDGLEVCRRLRSDASVSYTPIIIVTARADSADVVAGLEAGADEYLTKPLDHDALVARVRSMLRIKALHDTVQGQAAELADWNRSLEERVRHQMQELERLGRLKRFLSPQVAELIVAGGEESLLESHRRDIVVVVCRLHGFTAFTETVEPEEVLAVLRDYHRTLGELVFQHEGTLERFASDGVMVLFNDPVPMPDAAPRAAAMAIHMRECVGALSASWRKRGHQLGFRVGMAMGHATVGQIGFEGRLDYAAVGTVTELAAALCEEAPPDQILLSQRVYAAVESLADCESFGERTLGGFLRPVLAYTMHALKSARVRIAREDASLSAREREVAVLIGQGLTNRQIAETLVVAERTVATHIEHILGKLGFASRTQIGVWAAQQGLLESN